MKKSFLSCLALCTAFVIPFLTGCGSRPVKQVPLNELPEGYSLDQAKEDGCVVHENGDISSGNKAWESFTESASSGKPAKVRLGFYYTLDDPSRYDAEYYESIKDDYPVLYIEDLEFDGGLYTLTSYEDGKKQESKYSFLRRFEGDAETRDAIYDSYIRYVLTNDTEATWEQMIRGVASSQMGDYVDFRMVYTDYIMES